MSLTLAGTLPVSSLNIGLAATQLGIDSALAKLSADTTRLIGALDTNIAISAEPPNVAGYVSALGLLNEDNLLALLDPTQWVTIGAEANAELVAELGFVNGELALVTEIAADIRGGLSTGGLFAWSYAGRAVGYGTKLTEATRYGFGGVRADDHIDAVILATNAFTSWGSFSLAVDTGTSAQENLGATTTAERLVYLGARTGRQISFGLAAAFDPIDLHEAQLNGLKLAIEAQIAASAGLNLPDIGALALDVDLEAAIGSLNVDLDLDADIGAIEVRADLLLTLRGNIAAILSAGGLVLWVYSGPASELGSSFASAISDGLPGTTDGPNGSVYGAVIACASPAAWSSFGGIFKVAA